MGDTGPWYSTCPSSREVRVKCLEGKSTMYDLQLCGMNEVTSVREK